jgi:hypothetical protein
MMYTSPTRATGVVWSVGSGILVWFNNGPTWAVVGIMVVCFALGNVMEMLDELLKPRT